MTATSRPTQPASSALRDAGVGAPDLPEAPAELLVDESGPVEPSPPGRVRRPLYVRVLRLRHLQPSTWQRAMLVEGVMFVAIVLVLADLASAWTLLALPLAVAAVVKAHDGLAGVLERPVRRPQGPRRRDG